MEFIWKIAEKSPSGYNTPQKQGKVIDYPVLSRMHHNYDRLST
jgi:hypothetical protein